VEEVLAGAERIARERIQLRRRRVDGEVSFIPPGDDMLQHAGEI
jgi:hypothetical protein